MCYGLVVSHTALYQPTITSTCLFTRLSRLLFALGEWSSNVWKDGFYPTFVYCQELAIVCLLIMWAHGYNLQG